MTNPSPAGLSEARPGLMTEAQKVRLAVDRPLLRGLWFEGLQRCPLCMYIRQIHRRRNAIRALKPEIDHAL